MRQNEKMPQQNERNKNACYNRESNLLSQIVNEQTLDVSENPSRRESAKAICYASHNTFCLIAAEQYADPAYYGYLIDGDE